MQDGERVVHFSRGHAGLVIRVDLDFRRDEEPGDDDRRLGPLGQRPGQLTAGPERAAQGDGDINLREEIGQQHMTRMWVHAGVAPGLHPHNDQGIDTVIGGLGRVAHLRRFVDQDPARIVDLVDHVAGVAAGGFKSGDARGLCDRQAGVVHFVRPETRYGKIDPDGIAIGAVNTFGQRLAELIGRGKTFRGHEGHGPGPRTGRHEFRTRMAHHPADEERVGHTEHVGQARAKNGGMHPIRP